MFLTYRFWGLLLLYLFSLINSGSIANWLPIQIREISTDTFLTVRLQLTIAISALLGFYIAWAATRFRAKDMLVIAGICQLAGVCLLTLKDPFIAIQLHFVGAVLFGIGVGTITLSIPAILAGGLGGAQAFVIAFGLLYGVVNVEQMIFPVRLGILWDRFGSDTLYVSTTILALLGLLALLPVNPEMFTKPPQVRTCKRAVRPRNPVLVALGSLIMPYFYYLLYRFHGEVASLRPSPKILSPGGILFTLILFPLVFSALAGIMLGYDLDVPRDIMWLLIIYILLIPIMLFSVVMTTLIEPLNQLAEEHGRQHLIAPWVIFVFGILFPPVAMGLIQWTLNKSILMTEQGVVF